MARTLIRPTAFVDSPFGHDGKVARLAGGLNWFAVVELLTVEGNRRVSNELLSIAEIEKRLDDDLSERRSFAHRRRRSLFAQGDPQPRPEIAF